MPDPRPNHTRTILFTTIVVLLAATPALANASSAGMALGVHLLIGNLLIGLVEGGVLKAFGARWRVLVLALLANYASAWIGVTLVASAKTLAMSVLPGDFLEVVVPAHWLIFTAFTLLSFAIELPLVWLAFAKPRQPKRIVLAVAIANTVTAACLAAWYVNASQASLAQDFDYVDEPAAIGLDAARERAWSEKAGGLPWVYFISDDDRTIERIRLDSRERSRVAELPAPSERTWLMAGPRLDGGVDLLAMMRLGFRDLANDQIDALARRQDWSQTALPNDALDGAILVEHKVGVAGSVFPNPIGWVGAELDLSRPPEDIVETSPRRGMRSARQPEGHGYAVALPLTVLLTPAHASRLRGEVIVFELSDFGDLSHGIYVLLLDTMRISRLVEHGSGPCVVYENPPPGWDSQVLLERLTPNMDTDSTGPP